MLYAYVKKQLSTWELYKQYHVVIVKTMRLKECKSTKKPAL